MNISTFGKRLLKVRKEKKFSQEDVAKKIGVHGAVIGRYERDEVKPSIEMATKIANTLGVSLDYLAGNADLLLDSEILQKIQEIQQLPDEDKNHLFYLVDNILQNFKTKRTLTS